MKKSKKIKITFRAGLTLLTVAVMLSGCSSGQPRGTSSNTVAISSPSSSQASSSQAGSSQSPSAQKSITIGFVPMTLNNTYFVTMDNGAKKEAEKLGVKLDVQAGDTHDSAEKQLQIVETMIQNKVDALCIVPSSSQALIPALKEAAAANIPVINLDTKIDADLVKGAGLKSIPFYGTDNYKGAQSAAAYALKLFNGKKAKVAILTGIAGQQNTNDRRNGFADGIKGKLNIVAEQTANWDTEQGYNAMQNILQAHPDIDLIFASNDEMAIGALKSIKSLNKKVEVIGFDGSSDALNSITQNELTATVAQYPAEMGIDGVDAAVKAIKGKSVPENTNTGSKLIDKSNVIDFKNYLKPFQQ